MVLKGGMTLKGHFLPEGVCVFVYQDGESRSSSYS